MRMRTTTFRRLVREPAAGSAGRLVELAVLGRNIHKK